MVPVLRKSGNELPRFFPFPRRPNSVFLIISWPISLPTVAPQINLWRNCQTNFCLFGVRRLILEANTFSKNQNSLFHVYVHHSPKFIQFPCFRVDKVDVVGVVEVEEENKTNLFNNNSIMCIQYSTFVNVGAITT